VHSTRPPKSNSLCKITSNDAQVVKISQQFLHSSPFYPTTQNPMLYSAFNRPNTPKSASSSGAAVAGASIYPCNTFPGPTCLSICISSPHLQWFSHLCTPMTQMRLTAIKKLTAAINVIRKINCFTAVEKAEKRIHPSAL